MSDLNWKVYGICGKGTSPQVKTHKCFACTMNYSTLLQVI